MTHFRKPHGYVAPDPIRDRYWQAVNYPEKVSPGMLITILQLSHKSFREYREDVEAIQSFMAEHRMRSVVKDARKGQSSGNRYYAGAPGDTAYA